MLLPCSNAGWNDINFGDYTNSDLNELCRSAEIPKNRKLSLFLLSLLLLYACNLCVCLLLLFPILRHTFVHQGNKLV